MDIQKRKESIVAAYNAYLDNLYKTGINKDQKAVERWYKLQRKYSQWGDLRTIRGVNPDTYRLENDGILSRDSLSSVAILNKLAASSAPYHVGIELEIEGITSVNKSEVSEILATYLSGECVVVYDGSLISSGGEIVTVPLPADNLGLVKWHKLLTALSKVGCTSHEGGRCGLHIHVSRKHLRDESWRKLESFILKYRSFFKAISRRDTAGLERSAFSYCQFNKNHRSKYQAVNWLHSETIEFRFFRGTLKPTSFLASLYVIKSLVDLYKIAEVSNAKVTLPRIKKALLDNVIIKKRYQNEIESLLTTAQRQGTRTRRSLEVRQADARRELVNRFNQSRHETWIEDNRLIVENRDRVMVNCNRVARHSVRLPLWRIYNLPNRLRHLLEVSGITDVIVTGVSQPWPGNALAINYHRGGWGSPSRLGLSVIRVAN
jgi:hypothetical protein